MASRRPVSVRTFLVFLGLALLHSSFVQNSPSDYLIPHNDARAKVGVGPLVWDEGLGAYAQSYAEERAGDCELIHSSGPYGENLFWGSGTVCNAEDVVKSWVYNRIVVIYLFFYLPKVHLSPLSSSSLSLSRFTSFLSFQTRRMDRAADSSDPLSPGRGWEGNGNKAAIMKWREETEMKKSRNEKAKLEERRWRRRARKWEYKRRKLMEHAN